MHFFSLFCGVFLLASQRELINLTFPRRDLQINGNAANVRKMNGIPQGQRLFDRYIDRSTEETWI